MKIKIKGNFSNVIEKAVNNITKNTANHLIDKLKEATPVDTGNARDHWELSGNCLKNSVDYIDNLNKGSSSQAPAYFIEKTLLSQPGVKPNGTIVRSN
jgi:hypothetical protein